jgi:uncharacterized protein YegP (UPF0339 family)
MLLILENNNKKEVIKTDKWEFYTDSNGEWRWRRIAPNGRIVGSSSQGYNNKNDCIANATRNGYKS